MERLCLSVSDDVAAAVKRKAASLGISVSGYLSEIVSRNARSESWPPGFFWNVVGKWSGKPLRRASEGRFEKRRER